MTRNLWILALVAFAASSPAGAAALKFASLAPEGTSWMKQMHLLADELAAATERRVTLKLYPGGVAGDERDVLRKIRMGQLHGAGFTGNGLGEILPAARVFDAPFLFHTIAEYDSVLITVTDTLQALFRDKGYEMAGWASVGWVHLFSKNPIATVDDLKKARAWVWETDPLASALFAKIGISPIPLPLPQVLTSLQTGVVDAAYISPSAAVSLQWFTRVKYMTDLPLTHSTGAVVVADEFLRKLSPEDRATTLRLFRHHLQTLEPIIREEERRSLEVLAAEGIVPVPVAPEDAAAFSAVGDELRRDLADKLYPGWLLAMVEDRLAQLRAAE
ncbi:TRAP transporter substrate-binding protein DctP [Candidatus Fermentibacteria bacterium]|nr:TRAP transporter substrate-binding protein DctP [Candidatus Fermentibacteria bacterium]